MVEVASRVLRNNTRAVLDQVSSGEIVTITVDGRPVAVLSPVGQRPQWMGRTEFLRRFGNHQADPGLREELRQLMPETTEGLELPG